MTRTTPKKTADAPTLESTNLAQAADIFAQLVARPKRRGEFHLAYDPADHTRWLQLRNAEQAARRRAETKNATAIDRAAYDEAQAETAEAREALGVISFYFEALTPSEYEDLVAAYPATSEQMADAKAQGLEQTLTLDPDAFFPELVARTVYRLEAPAGVLDGITADQVRTLKTANYSTFELDALFQAVTLIHRQVANVESLGKG